MTTDKNLGLLALGALALYALRNGTTPAHAGGSGGGGGAAEEPLTYEDMQRATSAAGYQGPGDFYTSPAGPSSPSYYEPARTIITIPAGFSGQGYYREPDGTPIPTGSLSQSGALRVTEPGSHFAHVGKPGDLGSGFIVGDITPSHAPWTLPTRNVTPPQVQHAGRMVDADLRHGLPAPAAVASSASAALKACDDAICNLAGTHAMVHDTGERRKVKGGTVL